MVNFPYGLSDFYQIMTEGYFYIDRTAHIPLLENAGKTLLFLRPRRFGKSLLLSTLQNYYDVKKADEFEKLFGNLAIGQNPTPLRNNYLIMKWDFSFVAPKKEGQSLEKNLTNYINAEIKAFARTYQQILSDEITIHPTDAWVSFRSALSVIQQSPYKLYLLIDEYDNFANEVLMAARPKSQEEYETLVFSEGEFKSLFKAVKTGASGLGLDRIFITGVSPLVLHDVTSAFNIATDIYWWQEFNDLCGFTESELEYLLQSVAQSCSFKEEQVSEALQMMRLFYNGSLFSYEGGERLYNPTLVFHFCRYLQRRCTYPREMLDSNLTPDYHKIAFISQQPGGTQLLLNALDEQNPLSVARLEHRFGVRQILAESQTDTFMASLLYYLGVLTLDGEETDMGELILRIPNLVIRRLYAERMLSLFLPDERHKEQALKAAKALYQQGKMQPLCDFIERHLFKIFDNRDYASANELTIKSIFLTLLYNDVFYIMDSEKALARGYSDLSMLVRPDMRRRYQLFDILLELKYTPKPKELSRQEVRQKSMAELAELDAVKKNLSQAKKQLEEYQQALQDKYGAPLRLRTYAVVAIAFERLVWEEVKV